MSSTPFMASSSGTMTLFSTVSALAPGYDVVTSTVGGAMFGNCSTGSPDSDMMPNSIIATDITMERTGRSMNVFTRAIREPRQQPQPLPG